MAVETGAMPPAQRLLEILGPVDRFHDVAALGDFGMPARATTEAFLEPLAKGEPTSRLGPLEKVHVFWFAGMSFCDPLRRGRGVSWPSFPSANRCATGRAR